MLRQFIRFKSKLIIKISSSSNKKDVIKNLNRDNKALFGAVVKLENKSSNTIESNPDTVRSSEIYWLTQHKPIITGDIKNKSSKKLRNSVKVKTVKNDRNSTVNNTVSSKSLKPIRKISKIKLKIPTETNNNEGAIGLETYNIPFSEEMLKIIPKNPLFPTNLIKEKIDTKELPSVGKILQATMTDQARDALKKWKLSKISELGESGFADLQNSYLKNGILFHTSIQDFFKTNNPPDTSSPVYNTWCSVDPFIRQISDAPLVETYVCHPQLKYKGVVDCVANIKNELHIIEWKKSDRPKKNIMSTYDAPIQMCAYLGAINASTEYKFKIKKGVVVIAYTNGDPADVYHLELPELHSYWSSWLLRVQEYWIRYRDGTLPEPI